MFGEAWKYDNRNMDGASAGFGIGIGLGLRLEVRVRVRVNGLGARIGVKGLGVEC